MIPDNILAQVDNLLSEYVTSYVVLYSTPQGIDFACCDLPTAYGHARLMCQDVENPPPTLELIDLPEDDDKTGGVA